VTRAKDGAGWRNDIDQIKSFLERYSFDTSGPQGWSSKYSTTTDRIVLNADPCGRCNGSGIVYDDDADADVACGLCVAMSNPRSGSSRHDF
jgi:hypothetical protein